VSDEAQETRPEFAERLQSALASGIIDLPRDQWLVDRFLDIRADRKGVIAAQKRKANERKRRRRANNPSERVRNAVGARLWAALKGRTDGKLFSRLGYTPEQLVSHLESLFQPGMSWANYGLWHVDHRKPCAQFDLTDPIQFAACWAIDNLQPLWAGDNLRKGARDE
jgi:hypothetical protein